MKMAFLILSLVGLSLPSDAASPIETGTVRWTRDHDAALQQAKQQGKPVLVLFQEVPGCSGCKTFGKEVLSDPDLVKVIETSFIPLLVINNRSGKDADLLKKYDEPAWNYQVVRFLDGSGKDIIPRKDRVWDKQSLSQRMVEVLKKSGQRVPTELLELSGMPVSLEEQERRQVAIAQYCFWTGERVIGAIDGVMETEAGFLQGREVTLVTYDPQLVSAEEIFRAAASQQTGDQLLTDLKGYRKAPASDQKRQLQGTRFEKVNLTNAQATKVNAWARTNTKKALAVLTPEQQRQL